MLYKSISPSFYFEGALQLLFTSCHLWSTIDGQKVWVYIVFVQILPTLCTASEKYASTNCFTLIIVRKCVVVTVAKLVVG